MQDLTHLHQIVAQKEKQTLRTQIAALPDSLEAWIEIYLDLVIRGIRSANIEEKIELHLGRFHTYFFTSYGHERISCVLRRDMELWLRELLEEDELHPNTVNNYLHSLAGFCTWVEAQAPDLFAIGHPAKGIRELPAPPLEPDTLSEAQITSLKNLLGRLERFSEKKGRKYQQAKATNPHQGRELHALARPQRNRAMVLFALATGARRDEFRQVELMDVEPHTPDELRRVKMARVKIRKGKNKNQRWVYLSKDARYALAEYIELERNRDLIRDTHNTLQTTALFLRPYNVRPRNDENEEDIRAGRMSVRSINDVFAQIGRWHDQEIDAKRRPDLLVSPLHPHKARHAAAYRLAKATGGDVLELERFLGHQSKKYLALYTNPPEEVRAGYIESF